MKIFSLIYLTICLGLQQIVINFIDIGSQLSWTLLGLSLLLAFMLPGFWSIYIAKRVSPEKPIARKIYFWWSIGFLPFLIFLLILPTFITESENIMLSALSVMSGVLFFITIFRTIWIGSTSLTNFERDRFGKAKWHPFLTGVALFYIVIGMFFLDRRINALSD